MNKELLNKIKKSLLDEKEMILNKNRSTEVDIDGDETDEIQGKIIAIVNQQLTNRDNLKLIKIENALKRILDNTYGICEECEDPIAEKRLEFNPHFTICIGCAEQAELLKTRKL
jgi:DnaK suppressor protein